MCIDRWMDTELQELRTDGIKGVYNSLREEKEKDIEDDASVIFSFGFFTRKYKSSALFSMIIID